MKRSGLSQDLAAAESAAGWSQDTLPPTVAAVTE